MLSSISNTKKIRKNISHKFFHSQDSRDTRDCENCEIVREKSGEWIKDPTGGRFFLDR